MSRSIHNFRRALLAPELWLRRLKGIGVERDAEGMPVLHRTTEQVDAVIRYRSKKYLLAMPLTKEAAFHVEHILTAVSALRTDALAEVHILAGEMMSEDGGSIDLVLQSLPPYTFEEATERAHKEELLAALDALQEELHRVGFTHRNLKAQNMRWDGRRFIPVRYQDAVIGTGNASDAAAFDALREEIKALSGDFVNDVAEEYSAERDMKGHLWLGHEFEGLICAREETGYGYVDRENRWVIAPQYTWADDFKEGRAVVETADGMGVIDRKGEVVIEPRYAIVEYHPEESRFEVKDGTQWAEFDYMGRQTTPFDEREQETETE